MKATYRYPIGYVKPTPWGIAKSSSIVANATLGGWWADPVAAFAVVYVAATEAREHWQADQVDDCC